MERGGVRQCDDLPGEVVALPFECVGKCGDALLKITLLSKQRRQVG
jgi:hypothetical protein